LEWHEDWQHRPRGEGLYSTMPLTLHHANYPSKKIKETFSRLTRRYMAKVYPINLGMSIDRYEYIDCESTDSNLAIHIFGTRTSPGILQSSISFALVAGGISFGYETN